MIKVLLAATLLASGCGKPAPKSGDAYFTALNCQACHQIGSAGNARGGPDLTMVGFRKSAAWLDRWLADPQAWKPGTLMPDPHLSPAARAVLVQYLSSLKGQDWKGNRPWNDPSLKDRVERGHVLFARAGCVTCHGVGGAGGYPNNNVVGGQIPNLRGISQRYTKDELKRKIARGVIPQKADPGGPDPLLRMPAWGETLSDDEISSVVEYLWTLPAAPGASTGNEW